MAKGAKAPPFLPAYCAPNFGADATALDRGGGKSCPWSCAGATAGRAASQVPLAKRVGCERRRVPAVADTSGHPLPQPRKEAAGRAASPGSCPRRAAVLGQVGDGHGARPGEQCDPDRGGKAPPGWQVLL